MIKIKYILENLIALCVKFFCVFPIKNNRIVFSAYSGKSFSCNPKYIFKKLLELYPNTYDVIWAFNEPEKFDFLKGTGATIVKYKSLKYLYYVYTAKIYVDNVEHWSILRFRKKQIIINTWHGGGTFKQVGADRKDTNEIEKKHVIAKMNRVNVFVTSSRIFTDTTLLGSFHYKNTIIESGMPRNDILINEQTNSKLREELLQYFQIEKSTHILMFAPTFRRNGNIPTTKIDFPKLISALKQKFGGKWLIFIRGHYYMEFGQLSKEITECDYIKDVSLYPDMQELLLVSDVLITDYSSSIWDFILMNKPVFLYTPDIKKYNQERTFYWPIEKWPCTYAETNGELINNILIYDNNSYVRVVQNYLKETESFEKGTASDTICKYIKSVTQ